MKTLCLVLALALFSFSATAQITNPETEAIKKVVTTVFEGMKKCDSAMVKSAFAPSAVLQTIRPSKDGLSGTVTGDRMEPWLKAIAQPKKAEQVWDEKMNFDTILIDGNLAQVWGTYTFHIGTTFSHCGTDNFTLVKHADGWKIVYLIDTARKEKCL
ncbi:MAG: nuclear transport factor 2 family protein [Sphingobacteriaceae bacterium]